MQAKQASMRFAYGCRLCRSNLPDVSALPITVNHPVNHQEWP